MPRDIYPGRAAQVRARMEANVPPVARERVRLSVSALGDDATLVGAGELGFSSLMGDPPAMAASRAGTRGAAR